MFTRLPRSRATWNGHALAYAEIGTGPSILLLHGLGGTADFWQPIITDLTHSYRVLAVDLLGFGFSDKPTAAYTPLFHAQAVAAMLHVTGVDRLHAVVGHSAGGVIALTLVASDLTQTGRLVLAGTPYPSPRFPVRCELLRSPLDRLMLTWRPLALLVHHTLLRLWPLLRYAPVPLDLQGAWVGYMEHTIPSYVGTTQACLFGADIDPLLPALASLPTLLLYGQDDLTVPFVHGQRLAAALPRSVLVPITGGHLAVLRQGRAPLMRWLDAGNAAQWPSFG